VVTNHKPSGSTGIFQESSDVFTGVLRNFAANLNRVASSGCRLVQAVTDYIDMIYLLTAIGLSPGGSSTVHIYTQTIHGTT
jgi:hypothetical protein